MKYQAGFLLILFLIFAFIGCGSNGNEDPNGNGDQVIFKALVLENSQALLVEPEKDSTPYQSSDKIIVHTSDSIVINSENEEIQVSDIEPGQTLEITYNGMIAESYPAQIWADKINVLE